MRDERWMALCVSVAVATTLTSSAHFPTLIDILSASGVLTACAYRVSGFVLPSIVDID